MTISSRNHSDQKAFPETFVIKQRFQTQGINKICQANHNIKKDNSMNSYTNVY